MLQRFNSRIIGGSFSGRDALFSGKAGVYAAVQAALQSPSFTAQLQANLLANAYRGGDPTPTFTRATAADQIDFEGLHHQVLSGEARFQGARRVYNTLGNNSENLSAWNKDNGGTGSAPTVTGAFAAGPSGTGSASRVQFNLGAGRTGADFSRVYAAISTGVSRTHSVWLKSNDANTYVINLTHGGSAVTAALSVGPSAWVRYAVPGSTTINSTNLQIVQIGSSSTTNTADILVSGAMGEITLGQTNQNPSEYVSIGVLSAPFHGAGVDGVKYFENLNGNTVASNVVTEATGAHIDSSQSAAAGGVAAGVVDASGPRGIVTTPSLQNVLGTTNAIVRTMSDAGWVATNVTKGTATGVDGTSAIAASLTATAGNGTVLFTTVLGAAVRTYVPWVRRKTGTGAVNMTVDNGGTWTPITLTTAYQPFPLTTASVANPIVGFQIVTNTDAIEVDFNQLVAGSIAPAVEIPVNVTTAAEVDSNVAAGNIPANGSFTVYGELTPAVALGSTTVFHWATYVGATDYTAILSDGTNLIARKRIGGVNHDATIAWTRTAGTTIKYAASFGPSGTQIAVGGTLGTADATATAAQIGTTFQTGADGNGANQDYMAHRNERIYDRPLSTGRLQGMTQ